MGSAKILRQLMKQGLVLAPGVYNALFAKAVESTGFEAVYVTGFGTAARYGYPDVGLITRGGKKQQRTKKNHRKTRAKLQKI